MVKKWNINLVSKIYTKKYYDFLLKHTNIKSQERAYNLFEYSIKTLYGLDSCTVCKDILLYGDECIEFLKSLEDTPNDPMSISFEDRVHLVDYCCMYFLAVGLISTKRGFSNVNCQEVVICNG